jgi:hypothetical protein
MAKGTSDPSSNYRGSPTEYPKSESDKTMPGKGIKVADVDLSAKNLSEGVTVSSTPRKRL